MMAVRPGDGEELALKSAAELAALYRSGEATPEQAMEAVLRRTGRINPHINALFFVRGDAVMAEAAASTARWKAGRPLGPLDGVPVTLKDSIAARDMPYWRGCAALKGRPMPVEDSPPAARMREAGALIFAKATMPDLGMFGAGVSSAHGVTRNPWNLALNTGGSTSGGAAAVAAGLGACTVGSDIGGSVRLPAHFCGLFAIKASNGRVPHLPASSTRVAGPLARTVADGAAMLDILSKPDGRDHTALPAPGRSFAAQLDRDLSGLRIGVVVHAGFGPQTDPEIVGVVERAADWLKAGGATIVTVPRLLDRDPLGDTASILSMRAALEYFGFPEDRRHLVHAEVVAECERLRGKKAIDYGRACQAVDEAAGEIARLIQSFDYVLTPASPSAGFPAERTSPSEPFYSHASFTMMINHSRGPAAVVCAGQSRAGSPLGVQILGRVFDDLGVLQVARAIEQARGFDPAWPDPTAATRPASQPDFEISRAT